VFVDCPRETLGPGSFASLTSGAIVRDRADVPEWSTTRGPAAVIVNQDAGEAVSGDWLMLPLDLRPISRAFEGFGSDAAAAYGELAKAIRIDERGGVEVEDRRAPAIVSGSSSMSSSSRHSSSSQDTLAVDPSALGRSARPRTCSAKRQARRAGPPSMHLTRTSQSASGRCRGTKPSESAHLRCAYTPR
jgi:hypothetical protein